MEEPVGIKQIAQMANVSIGTVDRVLHRREGVSRHTRERVEAVIRKTGYKKNTAASRLRLGAHKKIRIAVLIPEVTNNWGYWELPKCGVEKAVEDLHDLGVRVSYYYFSDPVSFTKKSEQILGKEFDGIVTAPFFAEESKALLENCSDRNTPVVLLDTRVALEGANFICQDAHRAGMVAGRLLYGLAGENGLYIVVNLVNAGGLHENNRQREQGFRAFFDTDLPGKNVEIHTVDYPLDRPFDISPEIGKWLKDKRAKGVFVTNSRAYVIPGILRKYHVDNVHIVGFDLNRENLECLRNRDIFFLINQKPEEQGYLAVRGLFRYLTEKDASGLQADIPVEIVVRENLFTV
ncbi:substrate-binding domain-containing protein [Sinomicrobium soli]|uniref:substrate-binding domain-containing protein n=1 Tax=Sinomicrobium sp. N-1-3-6 TaxID=2219864 RepID=UPI000DCCDE1C|nr:LacI family DNA-binding transcriptional regulator [Sinomicrobium sp. N-1-3-6]RAV28495.1 hypothetical protein DN748_12805 [Sinomicrobium sp. N-1-3-6]